MSDLRTRLASALASRYAVESEIGRGGMATVFLAEDLKHGRKVAIKVLHPELAAALGPDRFLQEIRISANLDHPHILPVHDSGEAEGHLFFVMPYVEGESLRERLDRDGPLPVPEALRIAHEVARALDYAHGQGIVHRDIKPGNILLSEGHARIADFGVAKAVDAASDGEATAVGLAVGTPKYMSPEQGLDGKVDGRTDVYALGTVLYESLAGEIPFEGSPRAILAAKSTGSAPALRRKRRDVPAAVEAVVKGALAADPEDRYRTAGDLAFALRRLVVEEEAQGQRSVLWRELSLLGGVSALALGAVLLVVFRGGLPYWLLAAAALPLVLEVPFLWAAGSRVRAPEAGGSGRGLGAHLRRLRGVALAGAGGMAVLGVGSTSVVGLGTVGIGPLATLISRNLLPEQPMIVVADFDSPSDDPYLGPTIAMAMRTDLGRGQTFAIVEEEGMRRFLNEMRSDPDAPIDRAVALEIAERAGAEAILVGEVLRVGRGYTIVARLIGAPSEQQIWQTRETAADADDLVDATDRLSRRFQHELGEPMRELRIRAPLARMTTGSLDALRKFQDGTRAWNADGPGAAIPLLEEAVEIDPEFVHAHDLLSTFYRMAGRPEAAWRARQRACELRDGLPWSDESRWGLEWVCRKDDPDLDEAKRIFREARERFPPLGLGVRETIYLMQHDEWDDAANAADLQLRHFVHEFDSLTAAGDSSRDRTIGIYKRNLVDVLLSLHRFEEADTLLGGSSYDGYDIAFAARDYDRADAILDSIRAHDAEFDGWGLYAGTAMAEGRLADFEGWVNFFADSLGRPLPAAFMAVDLAWYRPEATELAERLSRALEASSLEEMSDGRLLLLVRKWVIARRPDRAREVLDAYERRFPAKTAEREEDYVLAVSDIAAAEGRPLEAVEGYRRAFERHGEHYKGWDEHFRIGRAFEAAGMPDSAIVAYERAVAYPGLWSPYYEYYTLALSTERLAELYDARGDTAAAMENYRLLTDLWEEADPELQPRVDRARRRIAGLSSDPSA